MAAGELRQYRDQVGDQGLTGYEREFIALYEENEGMRKELDAHTCMAGGDFITAGAWIMLGCIIGYGLGWWNGATEGKT